MFLNNDLARTKVEAWSGYLRTPWTEAQVTNIVALLVELSDHVVPHIVNDMGTALLEEPVQSFLLNRTVRELENWLSRAAKTMRKTHPVVAPRLSLDGSRHAVGLRTSSLREIAELPEIDASTAQDISRYLENRPDLSDLNALIEIDGIGPSRLGQLRSYAYLEEEIVSIVSGEARNFILEPTVPHFLGVLETSDAFFFVGDHNTFIKHAAVANLTPFDRFRVFVEWACEKKTNARVETEGALASDIYRWYEQQQKGSAIRAGRSEAVGGVLVNSMYLPVVRRLIDSAAISVSLMVFLGTAVAGEGDQVGTLELVEAVEQAAARGVNVRVVLDQDDGGEPYRSYFINRPLVQRFQANGVNVKFDEEDTLLHSKVLVVDSQKVVIGSHNWTKTAMNNTHELSVYLEGNIAQSYERRFDDFWTTL